MKKITYCFCVSLFFVFSFICFKIIILDTSLKEMCAPDASFRAQHIVCTYPHRSEWDVPVSQQLEVFVNTITEQPFYWLSKGRQAYAFASQDGEYVFKCFQQQRMRELFEVPVSFDSLLHRKKITKRYREKLLHREEIFTSSRFCFEEIPEETGFVYVHLNVSNGRFHEMTLYDQNAHKIKIQPDQVSFVIQRRAVYVIPTLRALLRQGKIEEAKARVDQLVDLLLCLARKNIIDGDFALIRNNNIGFAEDRAIYIDTGHLRKVSHIDVAAHMRYEFDVRLKPLYDWICVYSPELAAHYRVLQERVNISLQSHEYYIQK